MAKLKVMVVVGTRPEIIRLSRVIAKLDELTDLTLVHTGQNYDYELNEIFFSGLRIRKPDFFLNAAGGGAAKTVGKVIEKVDEVIELKTPEALLVLGDTNSGLAVYPAKRRKVPTFHMEAGNRCFDFRVPEEINRRIIDHTADVNLTYSTIARDYLLREGLPPDLVIKTGSPMSEVLSHYSDETNSSSVLDDLNLSCGEYFAVSCHREENVDRPHMLSAFTSILDYIGDQFKLPVIVSTHPRTKSALDRLGYSHSENIRLTKPLAFHDYIALQKCARAVLSDSGTISEEASILGLAAINIREAHERPEAMEEASVIMTGMNKDRVTQALDLFASQTENTQALRRVMDYDVPNVSDKVVRIILSYTDYVKSRIWKEPAF